MNLKKNKTHFLLVILIKVLCKYKKQRKFEKLKMKSFV